MHYKITLSTIYTTEVEAENQTEAINKAGEEFRSSDFNTRVETIYKEGKRIY